MAWSTPMTAVAGAVFTAAQFNQYVRDNLNATGVAQVTAAGQIAVSTGANAFAARIPATNIVAASESTSSVTYTDLTTFGPTLSVVAGTQMIVSMYASLSNNTVSVNSLMGFIVTGANTISALDSYCLAGAFSTIGGRPGATFMLTGLTPGTNTVTCKYRTASNTATFGDRKLIVLPL